MIDYKNFFLYYRAIIVAIVATVIDMSLMFTLSLETSLNDSVVLGISSFVGMIIQFVGQKYWTFKDTVSEQNELIKQIVMFFALEITLIMVVIMIYNMIIDKIEDGIKHLPKSYSDGKMSRNFVEKKENGELELTVVGKMILKSLIVFVGFNLVSFPMWKFFIFVKRKTVE